MNKLKSTFILLLLPFLTSCISDVYQQAQLTTIEKQKIPVYYYNRPSCEYEVIAYIEVNGTYYKKQSVFQFMADEAYKLKADAVEIDFLRQLDNKEYVGVGKAIRCLQTKSNKTNSNN